jgi:2,4-dichlorophenol 6-monooxygenase
MTHIDTQVLIVGGGGAGLTASMLLSTLGIKSLVVSALPSTSILPKAHVLNQRTMEILTDVGVADRIYAVGTPPENMRSTAWYAGFAGTQPNAGRMIARMDCWGAGGHDPHWVSASACLSTNLPQIRLEPLLRQRAEELAPGTIRFGNELIDFDQAADHVLARVRDHASGDVYTVRATYMLACDGGRTIGPKLGIELEGMRDLAKEVSIYMSADLSQWARDPDVLIRWIWLPETAALSVLVPMGPKHWGPKSEEWVFHLNYPNEDPRALDDTRVEADMRAALGIGNHPVTIHKISRWTLEGVLANRFRKDRIFMVGDAAHRHPPTGGLGLNSAIHDAHNICWKIAAVLNGHATDELLDTYEPERRSATGRNVQRSVENAMNQLASGPSLGMVPDGDPKANWASIDRLWQDDEEARAFRRNTLRLLSTQSMEFNEHNVEAGFRYASTAVVPDGTEPTPTPDDVRIYIPDTRPGSPLPHAFVEDADGDRLAIMDLIRPGRFLLIAGEEGDAWCVAARKLAKELDVPVDAVRIGHSDGEYRDPRSTWARYRQISTQGAILVRPDRYVAWRSMGASATAHADLGAALRKVLAR